MMSLKVYGIPNCGTCKKAFTWLEQRHIDYEFVNTKENPPSAEVIQEWVHSLGSKPMRNTSGNSYRALGEKRDTWDDEQWVEAFSQDVMLLKRPIFVLDGKAVLAGFRGPDQVISDSLGLT